MCDTREQEFFKSIGIEYIHTIGKGGFGTVYYVYSSQYKCYFAFKKVPENHFKQNEIDCLMAIDDPHIIRLYKYYKYDGFIYMLIEFCPGELVNVLDEKNKLNKPGNQLRLIKDIVKSIKACHDHNISHCDIKPSNFLIDAYGRIKISDFGMSTLVSKAKPFSTKDFHGTALFMAPELFSIKEYNPMQADIWALGVTLYYIATGIYPFTAIDQTQLRKKIEKGIYVETNIKDPLLKEVISRCLECDPEFRADINEILSLPYFAQIVAESSSATQIKQAEVIFRPQVQTAQKTRINSYKSQTNLSHIGRPRLKSLTPDIPVC